jgi:hypothetical protein
VAGNESPRHLGGATQGIDSDQQRNRLHGRETHPDQVEGGRVGSGREQARVVEDIVDVRGIDIAADCGLPEEPTPSSRRFNGQQDEGEFCCQQ